MTSSNGNIFRVSGPLCGEFTGPGEFPAQRPVTRSFDVFFDLRPNKWLSKQPRGWWFETLSWSLWRQCNGIFITKAEWRYVAWDISCYFCVFMCIVLSLLTAVTEEEKQRILDKHNEFRGSVDPPAANMPKLVRCSKLKSNQNLYCINNHHVWNRTEAILTMCATLHYTTRFNWEARRTTNTKQNKTHLDID